MTDLRIRDVLKKTVLKKSGKTMYMIVGIENQSDIHYAMVIKNMVYDAINYASQAEKIAGVHRKARDVKGAEFLSGFAKTDKILPVVTITIYWNSGKWDGPRTLHEMFDIVDERITKYVSDYKLNLIVPDEIEDFTKFATELKNVFEFVGISNDKNELKQFCKNEIGTEISYEAANLLNECFDAHIKTENSKGGKVKLCKGIEDWANESREEGTIIGFISACREFGKTDDEIMNLLIEKFSLTKEDAIAKLTNN